MRKLTGLLAAGTVAAVLIPVAVSAPAVAEPRPAAEQNPWLDRRVLNIAHQGGEIEAPSDTLYAFKTAVDKGADVLELDVHATADGELVVLHDTTVDRTTNGTGRVDGLTLTQIRTLDAAHWFVPDCGTCHGEDDGDYVYRGLATGDRPIPPELAEYAPEDFRIPRCARSSRPSRTCCSTWRSSAPGRRRRRTSGRWPTCSRSSAGTRTPSSPRSPTVR